MKDYRKLIVWERSHKLVLSIYSATRTFPKDELFGLTSQMRRAAASIPANIAEGCGRDTDPELKRFVDISHGSASELAYFVFLAHEPGYIDSPVFTQLEDETGQVKRMLGAFARRLKADR